jgi:hypothetical protein
LPMNWLFRSEFLSEKCAVNKPSNGRIQLGANSKLTSH